MVVKNIIAEDMPFTKSIFEQFWRSYCKKTIFVVFHFLKFLPISEVVVGIQKVFFSGKERTEGRLKSLGGQPIHQLPAEGGLFPTCGCSHPYPRR